MNRLVVLTGASGSGVSSAKYVFEEEGFYIVENPPKELLPNLLDSFTKRSDKFHNFCIILNVAEVKESLSLLRSNKAFKTKIILLLAAKSELIKRYALTRHVHVRSVMENLPLEKAIDKDLLDANKLVPDVDLTVDTSSLSVKLLRQFIREFIDLQNKGKGMIVNFVSFGLKNGTPSGLDMIFDVRSIPNPYWVEELKEKTGYDQEVIDYMNKFPQTKTLLNRITTFLSSQLHESEEGGRTAYNVGIACSGGQHRSTFVAKYLADYFSDTYVTNVIHRDTLELNEK